MDLRTISLAVVLLSTLLACSGPDETKIRELGSSIENQVSFERDFHYKKFDFIGDKVEVIEFERINHNRAAGFERTGTLAYVVNLTKVVDSSSIHSEVKKNKGKIYIACKKDRECIEIIDEYSSRKHGWPAGLDLEMAPNSLESILKKTKELITEIQK